jgi:hypothetical protein
MSISLRRRREQGFLPQSYSPRHRLAVFLVAYGLTRAEIAYITGYSYSHISRIKSMEAAQTDLAHFSQVIREYTAQQLLRKCDITDVP